MSEKFDSLESLVKEYYKLVEENFDGLPPYATFKTYLVDSEECINRPNKIKELVDKLTNSNINEENRIKAITELFATGGDIYVNGYNEPFNSEKLIHSVSNTTRLQVFLKDGTKEDRGVIVNRGSLLNFSSKLGKYIKIFENKDNLTIEHELAQNEDFKNLIHNNINSVINELLFWYYYDEDKYPIINSRAKNSRHIVNKAFNLGITDDIEFNKECLNHIGSFIEYQGTKISKQLMLDQLFYSIDEINSMKKVDEEYSNKENDIYTFYEKLWNTIKEAKTNSKLQKYYTLFIKSKYGEKWYQSLEKWSNVLHDIQRWIRNQENVNYVEINEKFQEVSSGKEDFLYKYLFEQHNGIASAGQGVISKKDREEIKNNPNLDKLLYEILASKYPEDAEEKIQSLIGKKYPLVKNRFLAALFSDKMTTVAYESDFYTLLRNLKKILSLKVESYNYTEQNNELMGIYLKELDQETDIYKKQMFYWWLHTVLNDNLDLKKAIVYYGAPGTGKTYKAKKVAKQFIENWCLKNGLSLNEDSKDIETVQFHPSYSYEDFIEGIRPSKGNDLELKNGIFKKFCKEAGKVEIELWENDDFRNKFMQEDYAGDFSKIKLTDLENIISPDEINNFFKNKKWSDFEKNLTLQDIIQPTFFIIDEINRADLSRVFGELMYSLEYRGYEGKISTQYSYLVENKEDNETKFFFEKRKNYFFIPQNVYIIGTMNTIDRSVDSFDFALRRRFSWEEITPNYDVIREELGKINEKIANDIAYALENLNKEITEEALLGSDYQIGHSYALNLTKQKITTTKQAKNFLWNNFIYPLLQEYFRGLGKSDNNLKELEEAFYKNDKK